MIRKFLDLSTGYLSRSTRKRLEAAGHPGALPFSGGATSFGWFAYCHDENLGEGDERIPADLWNVMQFARKMGCEYVMFDADACTVYDLPWYGDGDVPMSIEEAAS